MPWVVVLVARGTIVDPDVVVELLVDDVLEPVERVDLLPDGELFDELSSQLHYPRCRNVSREQTAIEMQRSEIVWHLRQPRLDFLVIVAHSFLPPCRNARVWLYASFWRMAPSRSMLCVLQTSAMRMKTSASSLGTPSGFGTVDVSGFRR